MDKTFTLSRFIQIAYQELDFLEALNLFENTNSDLLTVTPSQNTINNILNYSKAISIFNSKVVSNFGILLN